MDTEHAMQERQRSTQPNRSPRRSFAITVAAILCSIVFILAIGALGGVGALSRAYQSLGGHTLLVDSNSKSFGFASPGDKVAVAFRLTNTGIKTLRIVGCKAGCSCTLPRNLPLELGPNESRNFEVSIQIAEGSHPSSPRQVEFPLTVFTTDTAQFELPLRIKGEIR
jgi:hypothetical protein